MRTCIEQQKTLEEVKADRKMAIRKGIGSTPTVFINGKKGNNPLDYSNIKRIVEKELSK